MPENPNLTEETNSDLVTGLAESKRELFNLRFQHATGQLENSARMGEVRKQIARYRTEIRTRWYSAPDGHTYRTYALQSDEIICDVALDEAVPLAAMAGCSARMLDAAVAALDARDATAAGTPVPAPSPR